MSGVTIDTPDYQRGVVNAQVLLAAEPATSQSVEVGIPPNAETLVVVFEVAIGINQVTATGNIAPIPYTGRPIMVPGTPEIASTFLFDVSQSISPLVTINVLIPPHAPWFVYADSGVHLVVDASQYTNQQGVQYVTCSPPSTLANDHPPVELAHVSAAVASPGIILAAPGAGERYRIFTAAVLAETAGQIALLFDVVGQSFCLGTATDPGAVTFYPSGLPLATDTAVNAGVNAGSGTVIAVLSYTTEAA